MTTAILEKNTALLLAICEYSGQLSPSSSDAASTPPVSSMGTGGLANKITADLWYEQSRTLLMNRLRRGGSSMEGM
jgi:hypothetical protein